MNIVVAANGTLSSTVEMSCPLSYWLDVPSLYQQLYPVQWGKNLNAPSGPIQIAFVT